MASRSTSNGFGKRVVKPFMTSQTKFNSGESGEFQHQSTISAVAPGNSTDRNFMAAMNSSLSKRKHNNAQLYLRELKVVFRDG